MNKHIRFIKKLITTTLFVVTVLLYLNVNYATVVNLSPIKRPLDDRPTTAAKKATEKRVPIEEADSNTCSVTALYPFFEKLVALDTFHDRKLNIVHIGDSHIQTDVMINIVRGRLQGAFGNDGLGLVFSYSLLKTGGGHNVSFSSNIVWSGRESSDLSGVSGYALSTNKRDFMIELNLKDKDCAFNTLKIVTPNNQRFFELATNVGKLTPMKLSAPKSITHKVVRGETLYSISGKYHTAIAQLQKANRIKNNNIHVGQVLNVGAKTAATPAATQVGMSNATILDGNTLYSYYAYDNLNVSGRIYLAPNTESSPFTLNGIILENGQNDIIYHSTGVNGAHFSDYNKSPRLFGQIKASAPNLIIISLGTNEAFGRMSPERYEDEVNKFISAIRGQYGRRPILLTAPPPSLYKRKNPSPLCVEYANTLTDSLVENSYSVFDLYRAVGGCEAMQHFMDESLIAGDHVHYTRDGYIEQGDLLYDAFMSNYLNYEKQSKPSLKN